MGKYKFIEDALRLEAPIVIRALRKELENQKHIASGKLYDGFKDTIKIGSDSISLLITNDTPYMWLVNDGKSGEVTASFNAIYNWAQDKWKRGELTFGSESEIESFVQKVKNNLEEQYFTKSGDRNVAPYGNKRYFFIDIAKHKIAKSKISSRVGNAITKEVEGIISKELLKKEIKLTIG